MTLKHSVRRIVGKSKPSPEKKPAVPIIFDHNKDEEPMDLVATHQRCLIGAAMRTSGKILECGVGWYSTPLLHEIATVQKRPLWTVDNNPYWLAQFLSLENEWHKLQSVGWWGELELQDHYGLAFVDHGQPCRREDEIRRLIDRTEVFVMHDTEEDFAYGYGRIMPMFKYKFTDKCQKAWTTVASNSVDVSKWFSELPPVEPTTEVT